MHKTHTHLLWTNIELQDLTKRFGDQNRIIKENVGQHLKGDKQEEG